jgi:hypothetical protein
MAKQILDIGTTANDGTGDALRDAMDKCNDNFTELYDASSEEWAESTGTRAGSDLSVTLGDYDNSNEGTKITINDNNGEVEVSGGIASFITPLLKIKNDFNGIIYANLLTAVRNLELPDASGTLSLKDEQESLTTSFKIGDVSGGDYIEIGTDGYLTLNGAATVYDDLRIPVTSTTAGGTKDPDFAVFKTNGSGSQGVFLHWFDKNAEEELYFSLQLPHSWKEGSNVFPHVHWVGETTSTTGLFPRWGLEYTWSNVNAAFGNTTIIYSDASTAASATVSGDTLVTADKHHISIIGDGTGIDGTGQTFSSMLMCRIFRDATNATDDYPFDAGLLEIDFHYQIDSLGTNNEFD